MTFLSIARRPLLRQLSESRTQAIALAVAIVAGLTIVALAVRGPARAADDRVPNQVTQAKVAAMLAATSASRTQIRAFGEQARLINASLPFSSAQVQAARPFAITEQLDHRRALVCLTQAVYYEAGFEPLAGRRAVAQVVLNRMRHPAFPKSVCGVVYQGSLSPVCQFSFVCDGSLDRGRAARAWSEATSVAAAALGGYVEKAVGASTHYHANYVAPRWAPMLTKITQVGAHIFYRWPGAWGQRAAFSGRYAGERVNPMALRPPLEAPTGAGDAEEVAEVSETQTQAPLARAPNDVGGLLDVSKGWKLTIPGRDEIRAATAKALGEQRAQDKAPAVPVGVAGAPVVAAR